MSVCGVFCVHGSLGIDEGIGSNPRGDDEGGDTDTQAGKVVLDEVVIGSAVEVYAIARRWDVGRRRNMISEPTVFVKV